MLMAKMRYRAIQTVVPLHDQPCLERAFLSVPEHFRLNDDTAVHYSIGGAHDLHEFDHQKSYIVPGIAVCAINALFLLQQEKDAWVASHDLHDTCHLEPVYIFRAISQLDAIRFDTDGGRHIIEPSNRGSGARTSYRISSDIMFSDLRSSVLQPSITDQTEG